MPLRAKARVTAPLRYLVPGSGRPITQMAGSGGEESECSGEYAPYPMPIFDGRSLDPEPSVDEAGFELRDHASAVRDFYDDDEVKRVYYPEMEALLEAAMGATRTLVFDHNVRAQGRARAEHANARSPVQLVHNDFTVQSGPERAKTVLGAREAEAWLAGRLAIVNLWRAIRGPLESFPLAVCDARTIAPLDLVVADLVYLHRTGYEYRSTYNPHHRWHYFPRLEPTEILLIKVYDSAEDGTARFGLHTAFEDPAAPVDALPRESIEVRALAFFS